MAKNMISPSCLIQFTIWINSYSPGCDLLDTIQVLLIYICNKLEDSKLCQTLNHNSSPIFSLTTPDSQTVFRHFQYLPYVHFCQEIFHLFASRLAWSMKICSALDKCNRFKIFLSDSRVIIGLSSSKKKARFNDVSRIGMNSVFFKFLDELMYEEESRFFEGWDFHRNFMVSDDFSN